MCLYSAFDLYSRGLLSHVEGTSWGGGDCLCWMSVGVGVETGLVYCMCGEDPVDSVPL